MIRMQDYTPEVYYRKSRDFQFIGRLYDLVFNYMKTNADLVYNVPFSDCSDDQLIELLALTLGFKAKHQYPGNQLRAVCSVFSEILRTKGTVKSIKIACAAIFKSEGIIDEVEYELKNHNSKIIVYVPQQINNLTLMNDLLDYILPAGMTCTIVKEMKLKDTKETKLGTTDSLEMMKHDNTVIYSGNYSSSVANIDAYTKPKINSAYAKDTEGLIMNSTV